MLKKLPLPISGLMLSLFAIGNLLQSFSPVIRTICGIIATVICILVLAKILLYPKDFADDMGKAPIASVFATFPMSLMLLGQYLKPSFAPGGTILYYLGIALHAILLLYFISKFVLKPEYDKIFASYFIVFVGYVVASVVSPAFASQGLGQVLFYLGLVLWVFSFYLVTKRYINKPEVPEPLQPLISVYAAPVGLLLAGYNQAFEEKTLWLLIALLVISQVLYFYSVIKALACLKSKFYPSFSAFTFPFVITAMGAKMSNGFLTKQGIAPAFLGTLVSVETVIAALFVAFVLVNYIIFLATPAKQN